MKIRTKLALAFLLLAVLPLTGLVLYSYQSSREAVRKLVEAEAGNVAQEMEARMGAVEEDLERRVSRLGQIPAGEWLARPRSAEEAEARRRLFTAEMGEAAGLVESLEFVPMAPAPPRPPAPSNPERGEDFGEAPAPALPGGHSTEIDTDFGSFMIYVPEIEFDAAGGFTMRAPVDEGGEGAELHFDLAETVGVGLGVAGAALGVLGEEIGEIQRLEAGGELSAEEAEKRRAALEKRIAERMQGLFAGEGQLERRIQRLVTVRPAPSPEERERIRAERERTERLLGRGFDFEVWREGEMVGEVRAQVSAEELLRRVLEHSRRSEGEVPFALDADGELYAVDDEDREQIAVLPLMAAVRGEKSPELEDWVVVTEEDPDSGLVFGIARPIRTELTGLRRTALMNFGLGLGLIALALLGTLPLARHLTRDLEGLHRGAERIAEGDLETRVPVRSRDEVGQLARSFNHMTHRLGEQRQQLVEEERRRQEQELEQRLLKAEYERKSLELEEARAFQLSLLPRRLPEHPAFEIAVEMRTAAEVGGDYYDFRLLDGGTLIAAVGDATGHGARAGTMVTVIKSLFSAHLPEAELSNFLAEAAATIRRMDLGRMAMALTLARLEGRRLTLSSAGMPPLLVHRAASGEVEEVMLEGVPLGSLQNFDYREVEIEVAPGDTLLFQSDGLAELIDAEGDPLGYAGARRLFEEAAPLDHPRDVVAHLVAAVEARTGGQPPNDDVTFAVLRIRG